MGFPAVLLLAASLAAPQEPAWPGEISRVVQLERGPRTVTVFDRGAGAAVCHRLLITATTALPLVEDAAGFPFPGTVQVEILVYADREETGGYAGNNNGREINVWGEISDRGLIHELSHYWFSRRFAKDAYQNERWITEGLAEALAVQALRGAPFLGDSAWGHLENMGHWTSERTGPDPLLKRGIPRYPLGTGERAAAGARDWYARAYAFFHLLTQRLGTERLQGLNAYLEEHQRPVSSAAFVAALRNVDEEADLLIRGWHTPGEFHPAMHPDLLADSDGDGLSDAEEQAHGTGLSQVDTDGDGEPDGVELIVLQTDPCDASHAPKRLPYVVDGKLGDWAAENPSASHRYDAADDLENGAPPACDLAAAWFDADETYFYVVFRLAKDPKPGARFEVGIDADGDDVFDIVVTCDPDLTVRIGHLYEKWDASDWHRTVVAPAVLVGRDLEFAVPRSCMRVAGDVRLYAFSVHQPEPEGDWVYGDQLPGWIPFQLP